MAINVVPSPAALRRTLALAVEVSWMAQAMAASEHDELHFRRLAGLVAGWSNQQAIALATDLCGREITSRSEAMEAIADHGHKRVRLVLEILAGSGVLMERVG
jgi:hypothetical protein